MEDYRYNMSPRDFNWISQYISKLECLEKNFDKLQNKVYSFEKKLGRLEIALKERRK